MAEWSWRAGIRIVKTVADHGPALARTDHRIVRAADRALAAVGRRLRLHRESLGWSQTFAATKAKVHPKHMGVIENGKANVTLTSIVALARAYGVTLSELFDGVK